MILLLCKPDSVKRFMLFRMKFTIVWVIFYRLGELVPKKNDFIDFFYLGRSQLIMTFSPLSTLTESF